MIRRSWLIYGLLIAIWGLLLGWQAVEHSRVRKSARVTLINRAKDISNTLGLVLRSQRRFGGVISKERLESALNELIKPGELIAIALLNAAGDVVASTGGEPIDVQRINVVQSGERWENKTVTLMNLVDLGANLTQDLERPSNPTIVLPRNEIFGSETNRSPRPPPELASGTNVVDDGRPSRSPNRNRQRGRSSFGRPPGMDEEEYKSLIQKQGVHSFVIVLSTQPFLAICSQDLLLRSMIGALAGISVIGCGLAWRNLAKSSDLQIRLVRASELNSHLKAMNLAAAGLAHETRNPLNIVRGLAQMISKQQDASTEIRKKSREILDETDRVTAQLNEFINYSRPREVRRAPVALDSTIAEVVRTLAYDIEEKNISMQLRADPLVIEADEQLLRQALFNLVLNAIQAVETKGEIQIRAHRRNGTDACVEILDNGPGVLPEHRAEIFKPYFTTHQKGTGLGLAVVQQIILAHGWDIECLSNEPKGAIFRITHVKPATKNINALPSDPGKPSARPPRVLIVDDDASQRSLLDSFLKRQGFDTVPVASGEQALETLRATDIDMMISDVRMPGISGLETLRSARKEHATLPVLLVTGYADIREAVGAMRDGALNYLSKPIDLDELLASVSQATGLSADTTVKFSEDKQLPPHIIARSPLMRAVYRDVSLIAPSESRVLITGESGVGKEVLVDAIHAWSSRSSGQLVKVNCAAIPDTLLESELFGHERGAFTGASAQRIGRFELANGGTMFLDEIGEMSPQLQAKLLRVTQDGRFQRVGSNREIQTNARILASSNRNLEEEVKNGGFREDLFYRLNVVEINIPPLRERREDILPLANYFIIQFTGHAARFSAALSDCLTNYDWPGNVRELRNAMERASLLSRGELILPEHLPARISAAGEQSLAPDPAQAQRLEEIERQAIFHSLRKHNFNRTETAKALGISRRALIYKLQRFHELGYPIDPANGE